MEGSTPKLDLQILSHDDAKMSLLTRSQSRYLRKIAARILPVDMVQLSVSKNRQLLGFISLSLMPGRIESPGADIDFLSQPMAKIRC